MQGADEAGYFSDEALEAALLAAATEPEAHPPRKSIIPFYTPERGRNFLVALALLIFFLMITTIDMGCRQTKIKGGEARTETSQFDTEGGKHAATTQQAHIQIPTMYGPINIQLGDITKQTELPTIHSQKTAASTTQPTYDSTSQDFMAELGNADAGELGSVITRQLKRSTLQPMVWPVAGGFLALAALSWVMQKRLLAVGCVLLAALTFLFPLWVGIGLVAVIVMIGFSYREQIKEIVQGQKNALMTVPAAEAIVLKKEMERAHSPATKKVIQQGKFDATN